MRKFLVLAALILAALISVSSLSADIGQQIDQLSVQNVLGDEWEGLDSYGVFGVDAAGETFGIPWKLKHANCVSLDEHEHPDGYNVASLVPNLSLREYVHVESGVSCYIPEPSPRSCLFTRDLDEDVFSSLVNEQKDCPSAE